MVIQRPKTWHRTGKRVSHTVLRGSPSAAQRYLDTVLAGCGGQLAREGGGGAAVPPQDINFAQLLLYCLRTHPDNVLMIDGSTGEQVSNGAMLRRAVQLARALAARRARSPQAAPAAGGTVLCASRNHARLVALYYGAMMAGHVPLLLDPLSTPFELRHFIKLTSPWLCVCDPDRLADMRAAAGDAGGPDQEYIITTDQYQEFTEGHSDQPDGFDPVPLSPAAPLVLLPTSGSTGLAKAAVITHRGIIAQLPTLWVYHEQFPRPTPRAMFLSTAQWMTFTILLTAGPVFHITALISPQKTPEHALYMIETFKPTWVLLVPGTAALLAETAAPAQLQSLRTVVVTGAAPPPGTIDMFKSKVPPSAHVGNSYGMTEAQGFTCVPDQQTPPNAVGRVANIFEYKLVNDDGVEVKETNEKGELYLKSDYCIIKSYLNNEEAYRECATEDGWWRTGDVFYQDGNGYLYFVERKKFWFKYLNYHISPEELEAVIGAVPGVRECAVADTRRGAAAALVPAAGADRARLRDAVLRAVDSQLIEYKRLRGGVAIVEAIPRTHSGKAHRRACAALLQQLSDLGQCT